MMKDLILIDLDGTLLNSNKKIQPYTKNILNLISKDHDICLITSNHYNDTIGYYNELNLNTYLICDTGGLIKNPTNKVLPIYKSYISSSLINCLFMSLKDILLTMMYTSDEFAYIFKPNEKFYFLLNNIKQYKFKVGNYSDLNLEDASSIIAVIHPKDKIEFENTFKTLDIVFENLGSDSKHIIYRICNPKSTKDNALKILKSIYKPKKTISFGDSILDLQMLMDSDVGFIMENSYLSKSNYPLKVTMYSNNSDGVAKTLQQLYLPNNI